MRGDGSRLIERVDELLTAFVGLQIAILRRATT